MKVLFISDGSRDADEVARALVTTECETKIAECLFQASELIEEENWSIIVCPEIVGELGVRDMLLLKQNSNRLGTVPVVAYSYTSSSVADLLEAGCADFLNVPFSVSELIARLECAKKRFSMGGVTGSFAHISFLDLMQTLNSASRTGRLIINCQGEEGLIKFDTGQILYSSFGKEKAEAALLDIMRFSQTGGDFGFTAEETFDGEVNIDKRTDHLLISLATQMDEASPAT